MTHSKHTRAITYNNYKDDGTLPKGPSCGCLISLSNESSKVSFSHAHLAHVGHKALANFFFVARIFRSRIGDSRRLSATFGDYRRLSATVGDDRRLLECTRAEEVQKKCTSRLPYFDM